MNVCVVVPAYNEKENLPQMLEEIPSYVDRIIVVDDGSRDGTQKIALTWSDPRVFATSHFANQGTGAAIRTGYLIGLALKADVFAVMAGDGQMDPRYLPEMLEKIHRGYDYVVGNRGEQGEGLRRWGGRIVTQLVRNISGYNIHDSMSGYTVITAKMLHKIDLARMERGHNYANDMLIRLSLEDALVCEIPVKVRQRRHGKSTLRVVPYVLSSLWFFGKWVLHGHGHHNRETPQDFPESLAQRGIADSPIENHVD